MPQPLIYKFFSSTLFFFLLCFCFKFARFLLYTQCNKIVITKNVTAHIWHKNMTKLYPNVFRKIGYIFDTRYGTRMLWPDTRLTIHVWCKNLFLYSQESGIKYDTILLRPDKINTNISQEWHTIGDDVGVTSCIVCITKIFSPGQTL